MVKFILTEEQVADVLSASQKISGYVRNIETILAENAELYTEPKPQPKQQEPTFKEALQVVFNNREFIQLLKQEVENAVENQDPDDLCEFEVDERGYSVTIEMNRKWNAAENIANCILHFAEQLGEPDSYEFKSVLEQCSPQPPQEES